MRGWGVGSSSKANARHPCRPSQDGGHDSRSCGGGARCEKAQSLEHLAKAKAAASQSAGHWRIDSLELDPKHKPTILNRLNSLSIKRGSEVHSFKLQAWRIARLWAFGMDDLLCMGASTLELEEMCWWYLVL